MSSVWTILSVQLSVCVHAYLFVRVAVTKSHVLMEDCYDQNKSFGCTPITPRLSGGTVAATFGTLAALFRVILCLYLHSRVKKKAWVHQVLSSGIMFVNVSI